MKQISKLIPIFILLLALAACNKEAKPTPAPEPTALPQTEQVQPADEAAATDETETADAVVQTSCNMPLGMDEVEGETVICGTISVPENYDNPDGNQIPLSFALLKATGDSPAPDPIIFLHGGPGSGELASLSTFTEDFATVRQNRDVVVFDQRGAGFSNDTVNCATALIQQEEEINNALSNAAPEEADKVRQAKILEICADAMLERGVDLTQYNSINNARDVQSVAAALGYEEFNLYGHSYGTKLALETMRQQPAGLRSVILDSAIPPHITSYAHPSEPAVEAAQALFAACAADDACNAAYPDLEARFNQLMVQLADAPIVLDDGESITPATVVALFNIRNDRHNGVGISAYLPRMIAELEQGVTDTYVGLMDGSLLPPSPFADDLVLDDDDVVLDDDDVVLDDDDVVFDDDDVPSDMTPAETFNMMATSMALLQTDPDARSAYFSLPTQSPTAATLLDFIEQHIPEDQSAPLVEIAQTLDDDGVAELFKQIQIFLAVQPNPSMAAILVPLHLFVCNESIPFNTMETAEAYIASAPIPAFVQGALAGAANSIELCDSLPTGTVDASFHDPVASNIPILVMAGLNDTQTAISWGAAVVETMENGRFIPFPESGHGVYQFSQCAKDVAADFFNQPDADMDTTCTNGLNPEFALP